MVIPLTLTLSHRERGPFELAINGKRSPGLHVKIFPYLFPVLGSRIVSQKWITMPDRSSVSAPSPWGEGWGEGDQRA
jgi:hypothetical protein